MKIGGNDVKMNLYLFRKYWGKHKGRLFSLILSIILLTGTAVFSILHERGELRRSLHSSYNSFGNYALSVLNVTEEQGKQIKKFSDIDRIGIVSAIGTVDTSAESYTIGCFENDEAKNSLHLNITEGHLPEQSGQIVMPEFLAEQLFPTANIGDEITLDFQALNGENTTETYEISGFIGGNQNRNDMDYTSRNDGMIVQKSLYETPYHTPCIYIYNEDGEKFEKYFNYLISPADEKYFSEKGTDKFYESVNKLYEITDAENIISGNLNLVLTMASGNVGNFDNTIKTKTSDNIRIIRIMTVIMLIVAAISMFSGVISVMPQRIESLRLLRAVGMSKSKLTGIFITEFIAFWIMGNILGIAFGCGVHELIVFLQKMLGIPAYRGYFTEYIISQRTISPFIMPAVLSLIIAAVSIISPIKNIVQMTYYKKPSAKISRRKAANINSAFSKITGTGFLSVLSCFSMVIVIAATVFGYCYYTGSGKGTTYLSIGNENVSEQYFKVGEINIKENNIDCAVWNNTPSGVGFAVRNKKYGISAAELDSLGSSAEVFAWGSYSASTVLYDENAKIPVQLSDSCIEWNPTWEYYDKFKDKKLYNLNMNFISKNMMEMIGADPNDIILLSPTGTFPYEAGDTIPMVTALCDDNGFYTDLDTLKNIDVKITKTIPVKSLKLEENDILNNCGRFDISGYSVVMTAETAENMGFYYPEYYTAMLKFNDKLSNNKIKEYVSSIVATPMRITTIYDLERNAKINTLSANANAVVLFVLLFVLCIISILNLMNMNVKNNTEKFMTLHSLGLSFSRIKKIFMAGMMKTALISVIIGIAFSFGGKYFLRTKYEQWYSVLSEYNEMQGITDMSVSFIKPVPGIYEEGTAEYVLADKIQKLEDTFFLAKEMWLPNIILPLCIISGVILLSVLVCSLSAVKNIKSERIIEDDKN